MDAVTSTAQGNIALLRLTNPPVNGIGHALRAGLLDALDRALADPAIAAVVLSGGAQVFSGGADVREFGTDKTAMSPRLPDLIAAIEASDKPVIAAISGHCLGGGLELAMGCHFRVARPDALLGLPEVKLGLMPGAGGTQRLPRLLGLDRALNMIIAGTSIRAETALGSDLIDALSDGDIEADAMAFARDLLARGGALRRSAALPVPTPDWEALIKVARANAAARPHLPAVAACVEAVACAMTTPFAEGMRRERAAVLGLLATPQSRALRHAFAAERAAPKLADLPDDTPPRPVDHVGVIGAGTMGTGITLALIAAGLTVTLVDTMSEALERGMDRIRQTLDTAVAKGRMPRAEAAAQLARISPTQDMTALASADLIIEAVFEDMQIKRAVFEALDQIAKPGAVLASNTSALDLNAMAAFTTRPGDVVGLHFFSPANVMKLLEVVRGAQTAPDVLATALALAKRLRKVVVVAGVCEGFIGNRMVARYVAATQDLLDLGAAPQQIDRALTGFGMAMGPFAVGDLAGLDISWRRRQASGAPRVFADLLCEAGRFGQKSGAGWYRYASGDRSPQPDPEVDRLLAQWRADRGVTARKITPDQIVMRCLLALVNEGARLLAEGIAQRAGDIDVVYLNGYGFPRHHGGPMKWADELGLPFVVRELRRIAAETPDTAEFWTPAPLLIDRAATGQTLT